MGIIQNLQDIKCFLLDMDGTVYLGSKAIEGAAQAIERMRKNARVIFLTNNTSRARSDYAVKLSNMGILASLQDIYTAGNATIDYLNKNHKGEKVFLLGTDTLKNEFSAGGITITDSQPDLVVVGFDTSLTYARLSLACDFLRKGIKLIATHPDFNCPVPGGYIPDVGSFLALIKASTNVDPIIVCGKPFAPIADGVAAMVGLPAKNIAMVGDRLLTDMNFALNNNFTPILVLSGEATRQTLQQSNLNVKYILPSISHFDK